MYSCCPSNYTNSAACVQPVAQASGSRCRAPMCQDCVSVTSHDSDAWPSQALPQPCRPSGLGKGLHVTLLPVWYQRGGSGQSCPTHVPLTGYQHLPTPTLQPLPGPVGSPGAWPSPPPHGGLSTPGGWTLKPPCPHWAPRALGLHLEVREGQGTWAWSSPLSGLVPCGRL